MVGESGVGMAWMSAEAIRIVGPAFLGTVGQDDLVPEYEEVVRSGWIVIDGATLLRAWHASYSGERSRFPEVLDYEVAVNGRGIPDLDLTEAGEARAARLLRRGVAFARAALYAQRRQLPDVEVAAYVTVAPILLAPDQYTGNVTFCTVRADRPTYIDADHVGDEIVVALFTEDCGEALRSA